MWTSSDCSPRVRRTHHKHVLYLSDMSDRYAFTLAAASSHVIPPACRGDNPGNTGKEFTQTWQKWFVCRKVKVTVTSLLVLFSRTYCISRMPEGNFSFQYSSSKNNFSVLKAGFTQQGEVHKCNGMPSPLVGVFPHIFKWNCWQNTRKQIARTYDQSAWVSISASKNTAKYYSVVRHLKKTKNKILFDGLCHIDAKWNIFAVDLQHVFVFICHFVLFSYSIPLAEKKSWIHIWKCQS